MILIGDLNIVIFHHLQKITRCKSYVNNYYNEVATPILMLLTILRGL